MRRMRSLFILPSAVLALSAKNTTLAPLEKHTDSTLATVPIDSISFQLFDPEAESTSTPPLPSLSDSSLLSNSSQPPATAQGLSRIYPASSTASSLLTQSAGYWNSHTSKSQPCTGCVLEAYRPLVTYYTSDDPLYPWASLVITETVITQYITYFNNSTIDGVTSELKTINQTKSIVLGDTNQTITHSTPTFAIHPTPGVVLHVDAGPTYVVYTKLIGGPDYLPDPDPDLQTAQTCDNKLTSIQDYMPTKSEDWSNFIETYTGTAPIQGLRPIALPSKLINFLKLDPDVESQFHGLDIATCTLRAAAVAFKAPNSEGPKVTANPIGVPLVTTETFISTTYVSTSTHLTRRGCLRCVNTDIPSNASPSADGQENVDDGQHVGQPGSGRLGDQPKDSDEDSVIPSIASPTADGPKNDHDGQNVGQAASNQLGDQSNGSNENSIIPSNSSPTADGQENSHGGQNVGQSASNQLGDQSNGSDKNQVQHPQGATIAIGDQIYPIIIAPQPVQHNSNDGSNHNDANSNDGSDHTDANSNDGSDHTDANNNDESNHNDAHNNDGSNHNDAHNNDGSNHNSANNNDGSNHNGANNNNKSYQNDGISTAGEPYHNDNNQNNQNNQGPYHNDNSNNQPPPILIIGTETFYPGETKTINNLAVIAPTAMTENGNLNIIVGGNPVAYSPPSRPPPALLTLGSATLTANPQGGFVLGTATLSPGGPPIVFSGTTISLSSNTNTPVAIINGISQALGAAPLPLLRLPNDVTIPMTTLGGLPAYVFGAGTTLTLGGVVTVASTIFSLPATGSGTVIVLAANGQTTTSTISADAQITAPPPLTINNAVYKASVHDGTTAYVLAPGVTLTPGGAVTLGFSLVISLDAGGAVMVINGVTSRVGMPATAAAKMTAATTTATTTMDAGDYAASGSGSGSGSSSSSGRGGGKSKSAGARLGYGSGGSGVIKWGLVLWLVVYLVW